MDRHMGNSQVGSWVMVRPGTKTVRITANPPLLFDHSSTPGILALLGGQRSYANPSAIIVQMPSLTFLFILMFQRKTIGNIDRMKSVEAAMTVTHRSVRCCKTSLRCHSPEE